MSREQTHARAWVLGDDIDTDILAPGQYMKGTLSELAAHCLEAIDPDFAEQVNLGDVVIAGKNFGIGSSREQAAEALKHLGVAAVVAASFGGIFYRNALNLGLPVFTSDALDGIVDGEDVEIDVTAATLRRVAKGETISCTPLPDFLLEILHDGGLIPHLERKLQADS